MGLDYMLDTLPFTDVIMKVLAGQRRMRGEGLGVPRPRRSPAWTFVFFIAMIVAAFALIRRD